MGFLDNVDYKTIQFTRPDGVNVNIRVNFKDPTNLNEGFLVMTLPNMKTPIEIDLFRWINKKRYTLNELVFFAENNILCMQIMDKSNNTLASYGMCGTNSRIFNQVFGINFN